MRASRGIRLPFLRLHGRAGGDDVLPHRLAAAAARDHVVDGEPGRLVAAVLAGVGVAGEHRLAGDLAPVDVARDAHVADQPDHARAGRASSRSECSAPSPFSSTSARRLQHQHRRAADRADVDRLVARVEDEDPGAAGAHAAVAVRRVAVDRSRAGRPRRTTAGRPATSGSARSSMVRRIVERARRRAGQGARDAAVARTG